MSIMTKDIDTRPYTGVRNVEGKIRVKTSEEADWLDGYFNNTPNYSQIIGITRGKIYDVVKVEGFGDGEDITIIDDNGEEQTLGDFFFTEVDD